MFRNQYDSDVTVWSPQGRLHQVEYAMEAVKLGSATVGITNATHSVIVALKRAASELSAYQKKIYVLDDHLGMSSSGLTADARILSNWMRSECISYKYAHSSPMPIKSLIWKLGNKMQVCTQRYDKRPYGVGLLIAGYDDEGAHLFQTCPSSNWYACKAMAIGARSQSARTYLERNLDTFRNCSTQDVVLHALRALRDTLPTEVELTIANVSIGIVGEGTPFKECSDEEIESYLDMIKGEERHPAPTEQPDADLMEDSDAGPTQPPDPEVTTAMDTEQHSAD